MLSKKVEEALNAQINARHICIFRWHPSAMPTASLEWGSGLKSNSRRSKTMQ